MIDSYGTDHQHSSRLLLTVMKSTRFLSLLFLRLTIASPLLSQNLTDAEVVTDNLLFSISLADFEVHRAAINPSQLDWTSDGCTESPDNPLNFNFHPACQRHDFGYHNYQAQGPFDAGKTSIDGNFKKDLDHQCAKEPLLRKLACTALAETYYQAVKALGSETAR
jgi:hypothetical protein